MKRMWQRFMQAQEGVALIELAMVISVLLLLVLGTVEVARYVQFNQKVEAATGQVANLFNRTLNPTCESATSIINSYNLATKPFDGSTAAIFVSAVQQVSVPAYKATVMWQLQRSPSGHKSKVAPKGKGSRIWLRGIELIQKDQVLVVESYMRYSPVIFPEVLSAIVDFDIYKKAIYRPRFGSFQFDPCG